MAKKFAKGANKLAAIGLAAVMMASGVTEPLSVSANPAEQDTQDAAPAAEEKVVETATEAVTETEVETEPVAETEEVTETASEVMTEVVVETATDVTTEAETEITTVVETEAEAETTTVIETEAKTETTTVVETETETATEELIEADETVEVIADEAVALYASADTETVNLDLTAGLTAGQTYMDGMVTVGTDMAHTAKSAEVTSTDGSVVYSVAGYVTNSTNPNVEDGTGALIQFTPKFDGTINFGGQLGGGKTFYVTEVGGENIYEYANGPDKLNLLFQNIEVKAGKSYYIYAKGTKMRFYNLDYTYVEPKEDTGEGDATVELPQTSDIPAFPGVEGGGKYITGGRGRQTYTVTNLNDSGEGSLRWCLEQTKATEGGTIVFNVSGNIELKSSLRFDGIKNVTIAGQTAPGDGITVSGYDTNISNSENVIIRYMRFRPGALNVHSGGDSMDAMWGRDNDGFIIDHCSFSWNTDECLSLYRGENGSVQWCLVYESLTLSGHKKGRHGYGGIAGGDNVTFHHNLYANHTSRNPRIGGGYAGSADANHVAVLQMSNNLIYNWGFNTTYGGGYAFTNYMNNYALAGPGTRDSVANWVINPGESSKVGGFYINGNYISGHAATAAGTLTGLLDSVDEVNAHGSFSGATSGSNATELASAPYMSADSTGANAGVTNKGFDEYLTSALPSAESTYSEVLSKAGATYPTRDAQDARIVSEVKNGEGRYINTEHEVGGYLSEGGVIVEQRAAGYDSDADGMPDAWEQAKGLNANDATDATVVSELSESILGADGYTNLEVYLNSLVDMQHVAENPDAVVTSPANNAQFDLGTDVTVTVEADSDYGHSLGKVEFYYGTLMSHTKFAESTIVDGKATATLSGFADGSYFVLARVYDSEGNVTQTTAREIHVNADETALTEAGWSATDIGDVKVEGKASLVDGVLTVKGNGKLGKQEGSVAGSAEANAKTDACHYVYQEITGDVEITAKLESVSSVDNHAFAGIMIREDLDADAATAVLGLSWTKTDDSIGRPWGMYLTSRDDKGANIPYLADILDNTDASAANGTGIVLRPSVQFKNGATELGYWMRLVRNGNNFMAYCSADGVEWELIGSKTVEMNEKVYVGFAADSNSVANDIEQLNTARFSNVAIQNNIYDITYDLEGINLATKPETVTEGNDLNLTLTTEVGFILPQTVTVQIGDAAPFEVALNITDPMEGTLTLKNVTGAVTITADALVDTVGVPQVEYTEYDDCNYLTITEEEGAFIFAQTATDGAITSNPSAGKLAQNVSYVAFPKTTDGQTMECDITILDRTDDTSKNKGLFVGVFEIGNGRENFNSLGFRHVSGVADAAGGLTGYWMKPAGSAGNGGSKSNNGAASNDYNTKPSYELNKTYHVIFEKTNNGYKVTYQGTYADAASGVYPAGNASVDKMDLYKIFGYDVIAEDAEVQYGFALTGVTAKIENLTLKDSKGRTLFDMNAKEDEETPETEESSTEEPSTEEPSTEEPSTEEPSTQEPSTEEPSTEEPSTQEPTPEESKPAESKPSSGSSSSSKPSSSKSSASNVVKIEDAEVPMAEQIVEAGEVANVALIDKNAVLKLEVMSKYYGRNMYVMAHLGNGIGYSIENSELAKATEDVKLGSSMNKMDNFADGFDTFAIKPVQTKTLSYEVGLHVNVGAEYAGRTAYLFGKSLVTGSYELVKVMTVNEIGNVAMYMNEMTEVMILIQE